MIRQNGGPLSVDEDFFVMVSDISPERKNTPEEDAADLEYFQKSLNRILEKQTRTNALKSNG